jgi:hypothetical protein
MGSVIRPVVFATAKPRPYQPVPEPARRAIDGTWLAILVACAAVAWILALAGTAFAIRMMVVLGLAALAGRTREPQPRN